MDLLDKQLERDVLTLCPARGRYIGTSEHDRAREFIVERLEELDVQPYEGAYEHPYEYEHQKMVNIAGVVRANQSNGRPVLIGAHYDSIIPAPCADDNAAAVAITLAAAEALLKDKPERDVIIAIFDAEEPPYYLSEGMGSVRFYEDHLKDRGVEAAIIMDLVGHDVLVPDHYMRGLGPLESLAKQFPKQDGQDIAFPILKDMLFITGAESHSGFPKILDRTKLPGGLRMIATLNRYIGDMSDHAVFRWHNVPYLFLSCGRWRHYHAETDTPEKLNYEKMARIVTYLVRLTRGLCSSGLSEPASGSNENATVDFEIRRFKKAAGPVFPFVSQYLGLKRLKTREDIDNLVSVLLSYGL